MHINKLGALVELGTIVEAISNLSGEELKRVREAVEERRERLYIAASLSGEATVAASCSLSTAKTPKPEREGVPTGISTTGRGANSAPSTRRHKTDDPEGVLAEKLA
jgi:hypothetical protein